ncbi:MAG: 3-deoxy-D-manno-octulosonic acid transferase [Verrucomicrobiae bacterium]|nr:3-deoxy-D-manno-octulosonic acid transferase [Verrucomicrobiae bacterium]
MSSPHSYSGASLALYNLLLPMGLLVALPGFLVKMKKRGGYGPGFGQRFGNYADDFPPAATDRSQRPLWIHAVSVGEVLIAQKLIIEILRREPELPVVLSTTTSTGYAIAVKNLPSGVQVFYNPLDLPPIVRRVLDRIRPRAIVLIEAEVWPNLVHQTSREGIPVFLVNARLSPRSEKRYLQFQRWVAPIFRMLDHVCVQEPEDVARWCGLGVDPDRITHTGSIKFDQSAGPDAASSATAAQVIAFREILEQLWSGVDRPKTVLLASSHDGEEAAVGKCILTLRQKFPDLKFLVAPRHFERADAVERALKELGLRPCHRSQLSAPLPAGMAPPDTLIIDTTGELRAWQALPDLVVIGKSFLATGGQNPVEAISSGTAVITGPHMENFSALMAQLLKRKGIIQVRDIDDLSAAIARLLSDPALVQTTTANAREALSRHSGATEKTAERILAEK